MLNIRTLATVLALGSMLSLAAVQADAAPCRDAKGRFTSCAGAAAKAAPKTAAKAAPKTASKPVASVAMKAKAKPTTVAVAHPAAQSHPMAAHSVAPKAPAKTAKHPAG